jgi:ferric-dicitrate binding protein FerR (iron transport regulator)
MMEEDYHEEILALIARNLEGLADDSEVKKLKLWISESVRNKDFYVQIKNLWDASDRNMDTNQINTPMALTKVLNRIRRKSCKKTIWLYWQRIAAVLLIPLLASSLLLFYFGLNNSFSTADIAYNEVFAAFGTHSSLRLSDSTIVWLNSGSSIRYPVKFTGNNAARYF